MAFLARLALTEVLLQIIFSFLLDTDIGMLIVIFIFLLIGVEVKGAIVASHRYKLCARFIDLDARVFFFSFAELLTLLTLSDTCSWYGDLLFRCLDLALHIRFNWR